MAEGNRDRSKRPGRPDQGRPRPGSDARQGQRRSQVSSEVVEVLPRPEPIDCPICQKPIYDLSTAMAEKESGSPAHFDCILQRLTEAESLGPSEKIVYVGGGVFGVIEYAEKTETRFTVKRRIRYEEEGKKQDWRKALSIRVLQI